MLSKTKTRLPLAFLFASIHLIFVLHLHHESCKEIANHYLLLPLIVLPFYFTLPFNKATFSFSGFTKNTLAFSLGFIGTVYLQNHFNAVISSALVATAFVLISEIKSLKLSTHQAAVYTGTFAGMLSSEWIPNHLGIAVSCVLGSVLFSLFNNSLLGFGGKMGTIGFGSLIIWVIVQW
ncbi:MAG: hypothetical protein ACJA0Q_001120 [Saprospiraceae bacterium]|jgi:hypothetical protein